MGKPLFDVEDAFDIFTPFIVLLIAFFSAKFLRIARLRLRLWRQNRRHAREEQRGRLTDGIVGLTPVTTEAVTARPEPPRLQVRREWTPASPEVPTAPRRPAAGATAARDRRLSRLKEYAYDASAEQADGDECTICFEDFSGGERIRELPCGTIGHRASRGRRTRPHFTSSFSDLRTVLSFSLSGVAGHTFHVDCVDEWLLRHASCPICRRDVFATTVSAPPRAPLAISDGYHAGRGVRAAAAVAAAAMSSSSQNPPPPSFGRGGLQLQSRTSISQSSAATVPNAPAPPPIPLIQRPHPLLRFMSIEPERNGSRTSMSQSSAATVPSAPAPPPIPGVDRPWLWSDL